MRSDMLNGYWSVEGMQHAANSWWSSMSTSLSPSALTLYFYCVTLKT